ncbi:MAG: hypothetical protein E7Z91_02620 [Cyanobacteria bacterium SIG30]|nr:hypothetical protein [Cyanobacteria bacterium SIG30]
MITKIKQKNNVYYGNNYMCGKKISEKKHLATIELVNIPLSNMLAYLPNLSQKKCSKLEKIIKLNIPNLHIINGDSVRGESLSHKRNKSYIRCMKDYGIEQIIDLKTSDYSDSFKHAVESNGLRYYHFPLDSDKQDVREIIEYLPNLFSVINKGNYYIACAQGLHRTDIALATNYLFNKNAGEQPPILYGHITKKGIRCEDIFKRTNSIFRTLTSEDRKRLGLSDYDDKLYKAKKNKLIEYNKSYINNCI